MIEIQPRKGFGKLSSALRVAGAVLVLNTACGSLPGNPNLPLSAKESLSSAEGRLLENGLRLDGSGFILIPYNSLPDDNFVVEALLTPDPPSKIVSQITKDAEVLYEDVYTIFAQNGTLQGLQLAMYTRENSDNSITYSFVVHWRDKNDPLDISTNSCPVVVGRGAERKVSAQNFAKPKNITLKVKEGKPEVFEGGKRIGMRMGREYITPKGDYTRDPEEYRSGYLVYNQLIEIPCNIKDVGLGIGGAMFPDGSLAGHFNGEIYQASIRSITEGKVVDIARLDFKNGLRDLSGNGYDARIVGEVSLVQK